MLNFLSQKIQNPQLIEPIRNFTAVDYTNRLIPVLINVGYILCVLAFVLLLIFGGIQWITSGGGKDKLESARSKIINAITGLFILFILWVILKTINVVFGINLGNVGVPYVGPSAAPTPFYMSCGGGTSCIPVSGLGSNECGSSADCMGSGYHLTCFGATCSRVVGAGVNTCFPQGNSCSGTNAHYECASNQCVLVSGVGANTCAVGSACDIPVGGNCMANSNCATGYCNSTRDTDADGFNAAVLTGEDGACSASPSDCNDNNNLVFPGQTQYFQDPIAGTTNNFNYDCVDGDGDGDPNDRWPQLNCLSGEPHYTSCQTTPLTENVIRPLTGFELWIPVCGENLIFTGSGTPNEFFSCNASHYPTCVANPEVADFSCFADCYTGNTCGWNNDLACISWRMNGWPVWPSGFSEDYPGGLYRMPCR